MRSEYLPHDTSHSSNAPPVRNPAYYPFPLVSRVTSTGVDTGASIPVISCPTAAAKHETAVQMRQEAFRGGDGTGYTGVEDAAGNYEEAKYGLDSPIVLQVQRDGCQFW